MKKEGKKYLIKESELKEIIQEMFLMEVYDTAAHRNMYIDKSMADKGLSDVNVSNIASSAWNIIKSIPNAIIPDSWKEKAYNDSDVMQYILGLLGAQKEGSARADFIPNWGQWGGKTQNGDAHEVLNSKAACDFILANASPKSTHWCARHVRMALNRGGLSLPYGNYAPSAKYYYNILRNNGWDEIPVSNAGNPCDVVVIDQCVDSKGNPHNAGHIAMCVGNGTWVSDFVQRTMYGLRGTPPPSAVHVFRYRNIK